MSETTNDLGWTDEHEQRMQRCLRQGAVISRARSAGIALTPAGPDSGWVRLSLDDASRLLDAYETG